MTSCKGECQTLTSNDTLYKCEKLQRTSQGKHAERIEPYGRVVTRLKAR